MRTSSNPRARKSGLAFGSTDTGPDPVDLSQTNQSQIGVSISLKHYRPETECFSKWQSGDLKRFSALIEKMRGLTAMQLREHGRLCIRHGVGKKAKRYHRPSGLAADATFYELKLDATNAPRIHGVFEGSVFHLVFLDAKHQVYAS